MIYKTKSLIVAEKVLLELTDILNCPDSAAEYREIGSIVQEAYQNGREQGFIVWPLFAPHKAFYVAQERRSDSIVVYFGDYTMQSISDDAHRHPTYFRENTSEEAAVWIANELSKLWVKSQTKAVL